MREKVENLNFFTKVRNFKSLKIEERVKDKRERTKKLGDMQKKQK